MIHLNEITWDFEPRRKIMLKLAAHGGNLEDLILMTEIESAFLCGALKKFRPKKILEVGVAAGGTTSIVMQALEGTDEPCEMHSVDLRKKHWVHKTEDIGFLAVYAKENNLFAPPQSELCVKNEFYLGTYLPQVIDTIGGDIDFVILDTVHFLPGEALDVLAMLPYLKDGAIVVLHDVALNQYKHQTNWRDACATGAVFSTVTGEKFLNFVPLDAAGNVRSFYPNIGMFQVNEQTRANIENVFLLLTLNWHYVPSGAEIKIYREFYRKHYPKELVDIFNEIVKMHVYNKMLDDYR